MNVLSVFDGMSCGQIALERAGIKVDNYYASEIDKYAIKVTQANYPKTVQLGDVTKHGDWGHLPKIDLLMGGTPCNDFSFAGKQKGMVTECKIEITSLDQYLQMKADGFQFNGQSYLFWEYVDILKTLKPKYFLLENVVMAKKWQKIITDVLGVEPTQINSSLVSAQNRRRLYWCNWDVEQPEDKGIILKDIIESDFSGAVIKNRGELQDRSDKTMCLDANYHKGADNHGQRTRILDNPVSFTERRTEEAKRIRRESMKATGRDFSPRRAKELVPRTDNKMNCLTATYSEKEHNILDYQLNYRKLTPIECEMLQTVQKNYTNHVSKTQRYKMLGNGWTVDVIAHIFLCLWMT